MVYSAFLFIPQSVIILLAEIFLSFSKCLIRSATAFES